MQNAEKSQSGLKIYYPGLNNLIYFILKISLIKQNVLNSISDSGEFQNLWDWKVLYFQNNFFRQTLRKFIVFTEFIEGSTAHVSSEKIEIDVNHLTPFLWILFEEETIVNESVYALSIKSAWRGDTSSTNTLPMMKFGLQGSSKVMVPNLYAAKLLDMKYRYPSSNASALINWSACSSLTIVS